ncbi:hypothetical protein AMTRI_Chr10g226870 [Amborella trichopoda]
MTNGNSFSSSVIDFTSPFHLTNNDNPGNIIVSYILEGENYPQSSRAMTTTLSAKNKLSFIADSILNETTAQCMWDNLKDRFSQSNATYLFKLRLDLVLVSQGYSTISAYYTKLKSLWEELASYTPLPPCSCGYSKALFNTTTPTTNRQPRHPFNNTDKAKGPRKQRPKCDHWTSSKPIINEKNIVATNSSQSSLQFTHDQYCLLLSMLTEGNAQPMVKFAGNSTSSPSSILLDTWIVDTGTSDHMIIYTSLFHSSAPVSHIAPVKLPNGSFASVTHIGSVLLTPTLCLHQVLCVPSFG